MICPNCYGPSRITRTLDTGTEVARMHECLDVSCDSVWTTDQKLRSGSLRKNRRAIRRQGTATYGISGGTAPPATVPNLPAAANSGEIAGGVGGGLSADWSDLIPDSVSDPSRSLSSLDRRASARGPFVSRPNVVHVGAATPAFMRVYRRYPNPHRMQQAAQVWQSLVPSRGGEDALAAEIESAFDAGFLKRHPYSGEQRVRPKFEDFLAELRWLEPEPAPDPVAVTKPAETFEQRDARARREGLERRLSAKADLEAKERAAEAAIAARLATSGGAA